MRNLSEEELPVLINGADLFVDRLIRGETGLIKSQSGDRFNRIIIMTQHSAGRMTRKRDISFYLKMQGSRAGSFLLEYTTDESLKRGEQFCMKTAISFISPTCGSGFLR